MEKRIVECPDCLSRVDLSPDGTTCRQCGYVFPGSQPVRQPEGPSEEAIRAVMISTEALLADHRVVKRLDIVTAECVYGVNIFRDLFAAVRDIVGGRAQSIQDVLRDARKTCLYELKREAARLGANAVIGVDLDYSELSGGGKSGLLLLVASGTAVVLEPVL